MFISGLNNVDLSNGQFFPVYKFSWFFPGFSHCPVQNCVLSHKKQPKKLDYSCRSRVVFVVIKNSFEQGNGKTRKNQENL